MGVKLGPNRVIVLNNLRVIKEAYALEIFNGRPLTAAIKERNKGEHLGVAFSEGPVHTEQRRFVLKNLRDLGFGKKTMESLIITEINEVIQTFSKKIDSNGGKSVSLSTANLFNHAILNALWHIACGKRYAHDDPELKRVVDGFAAFLTAPKITDVLMQFFPAMEKLVVLLPGILPNSAKDFLDLAKSLLKGVVTAEQETYVDGVKRHFVDVYLEQIKATEDKTSSFYNEQGEKNLFIVMLDLLIAGSETTSSSLTWSFLLLAANPQVQEKLYAQILDKVGTSRQVSLADQSELVYLEAVIMEILRFSSLTPFGLPHRNLETVEFHGYTIPQNTMIFANYYAVHRNNEIWGDAQNFRPERFLSQDGKSIVRNEALLSFGTGKRICIGESLAREELKLFIGNLVQRFKWSAVPGEPALSTEPGVSTFGVGFRLPKPHRLLITDRFA